MDDLKALKETINLDPAFVKEVFDNREVIEWLFENSEPIPDEKPDMTDWDNPPEMDLVYKPLDKKRLQKCA